MSIVTRAELKTYLGLTTTADDALIDQLLADAVGQAERDTGRVFSASSNASTVYSTDGQYIVGVRDMPQDDPSRVVTFNGVSLTSNTNYWALPDRRDPRISTTIQVQPFDSGRRDGYKVDPDWFDKNLDRLWGRAALPNDLQVTGIEGHPFPHADITGNVKLLTAWLYWRAKSGASGTVSLPDGTPVELGTLPPGYADFVRRWRTHPGVRAV